MKTTVEFPQRLILIDGHALIYRAYHAFPDLSTPEGVLVNAVYGFSRILLKAIRDFKPEYLAVTFDHKAPTNRSKLYNEYKAHRPEMPDDLKPQIQIIKDFVNTLNIPSFDKEGFEADDLIGTISRKIEKENNKIGVLIVTGDKDLLQLITRQTRVFIPSQSKYAQDTEYDEEKLKEKFNLLPRQIIDYKALRGDVSDNIPGVAGIGDKTATRLLEKYDNLENILSIAQNGGDQFIKGLLLKKLTDGFEMAKLSQELATVNCDVSLDFNIKDCVVKDYDKTKAVEFCNKLEFKSLIPLLPQDSFEEQVQNYLF